MKKVWATRSGSNQAMESKARSLSVSPYIYFLNAYIYIYIYHDSPQPSLLELKAPINIFGDIPGQYSGMLRLLDYGSFPPTANYLFLGDYMDQRIYGFYNGFNRLFSLAIIFSAPNYCSDFDNAGALISVDESLMYCFQILKHVDRRPGLMIKR
ncbi:hypothetical protein F2Q69_00053394, partial [Brassica cretica]